MEPDGLCAAVHPAFASHALGEKRIQVNSPPCGHGTQYVGCPVPIGESRPDRLTYELRDMCGVAFTMIKDPRCGFGWFLHWHVLRYTPAMLGEVPTQVEANSGISGLCAAEDDELVGAFRHVSDSVYGRCARARHDRVWRFQPSPRLPGRCQAQPGRVQLIVCACPGTRDPVKTVTRPFQPAVANCTAETVVIRACGYGLCAGDEAALGRRRVGDGLAEIQGPHKSTILQSSLIRPVMKRVRRTWVSVYALSVTLRSMATSKSARSRHQSLRDQARNAAKDDPVYGAQERLRFFAFSRFLARVFTSHPDDWVLKGAGALLARLPAARASNDIDLVVSVHLDEAEGRLRDAAALNLDDGFSFVVRPGTRPITGNNRGIRLTAEALIGARRMAVFRVDVVVNCTNTQPIESVPPARPIPSVESLGPDWRVYPIADHLADKVCATYEHADPTRSTRFHDLVDITLIACNLEVWAADLARALEAESQRRGITLPGQFLPPDWSLWERGFNRLRRAAGPLGVRWPSYPEAVAIAQSLLDPVLSGQRDTGVWVPGLREWSDAEREVISS